MTKDSVTVVVFSHRDYSLPVSLAYIFLVLAPTLPYLKDIGR